MNGKALRFPMPRLRKFRMQGINIKNAYQLKCKSLLYQAQESRNATEAIMKQCEPVLSQMREVYLAEKVPGTIADRHLRQMRMQTTRNVLQGMMFSEAARKSGQQ